MKPLLMLLIFSFFLTPFSFAQNRVGNGGGAWVCRNKNSSIRWIQVIDLFEASEIHELPLKLYTADYREITRQISSSMINMATNPLDGIAPFFKKVNNLIEGPQITYVDKPLPFINDALYFAVPKRKLCLDNKIGYEQIVKYESEGKIFVNRPLFNALPETHKAALVVHEAVYAYRRSLGDTDSINSRRIVGLAFSRLPAETFSWYLKFLKDGSAPIIPGSYKIFMNRITSNGDKLPIQNVAVTLKGFFCNDSHWFSISTTSDPRGFAYVNTECPLGHQMSPPSIELRLDDGITYWGTIPFNGWASRLATQIPMLAKYSCEVVAAIGSDVVRLICVEK